MNEDLIVEEVPLNNNEEIILNLNNVNSSINEITEFLKEQKRIEEKKEEDLKEQEKLDAPQLKKEAEEKQQKELEFIQNIETIATNTNSEIIQQSLNDVSTLMQVNIISNGLLIGIVCISLLSKFFKK